MISSWKVLGYLLGDLFDFTVGRLLRAWNMRADRKAREAHDRSAQAEQAWRPIRNPEST